MFAPYGEIISAIVMKNEEGLNLGFGFVCYKEGESAVRALNDLNAKGGLYVR